MAEATSRKLWVLPSRASLKSIRVPRRRLGIRTVIIAGMVAVIGSLMTITTLVDVQRQRATEREDLEERGVLLSNSLSSVLANPIRFNDTQGIGEIAKAIWAQPDVSFVKVFDAQGNQVVGPGEDQFPVGVTDSSVIREVSDLHTAQRWTEGQLEVMTPVRSGASLVGAVHFGFDTARIDDDLRDLTVNRLLQTVALILSGIGVSFIVASYITGPIRILLRASNRLAAGNLSARASGMHGREMNELGLSFNRMADELQEKVLALEESRSRIVSVQENIRRDIAVHLHGPVQGRLLALKAQLEQLQASEAVTPVGAATLGAIVDNMGEVIQDEVSTLSRRLYPAIVRRGVVVALQSLADQFDSTLEIELDLDSDIAAMERQSTGLIAEDVRLASYRIAEEAMSNVVKHSKAKSVTIRLNVDQDLLVLVIEDDGTGFEGSPAAGSLGLAVMTDYAQAVGGECSFESVPGRGTTIFARLPIR